MDHGTAVLLMRLAWEHGGDIEKVISNYRKMAAAIEGEPECERVGTYLQVSIPISNVKAALKAEK